jgi:hypothetical protein
LGACSALLGDELAQPLAILLLMKLIRHARYTAHSVYRTMPYRLTLDVPYRFITRPAFERAAHCVDLAPESLQNLYHDTGAGVLILTPSTLDHRWRENTVTIDSINKQAQFWREVYRSAREASENPGRFMGSILRANQDRTQIEWYISIAIAAIRAGQLLRWVAETQFSLQRDEGWAVHIQCADDEYTREGITGTPSGTGTPCGWTRRATSRSFAIPAATIFSSRRR